MGAKAEFNYDPSNCRFNVRSKDGKPIASAEKQGCVPSKLICSTSTISYSRFFKNLTIALKKVNSILSLSPFFRVPANLTSLFYGPRFPLDTIGKKNSVSLRDFRFIPCPL